MKGESREHEVTEAGRDFCIDVFRAAAALREKSGKKEQNGKNERTMCEKLDKDGWTTESQIPTCALPCSRMARI